MKESDHRSLFLTNEKCESDFRFSNFVSFKRPQHQPLNILNAFSLYENETIINSTYSSTS